MKLIHIIFFSLYLLSCNDNLENSPNFILILADDQGWSGTSVKMSSNIDYSKSQYFETPNLERLSMNGMKFSRGYSSSPVCSPSRYSIQFGQTTARLKMIRVGMNTKHIDHHNANTIPKLLKKINPNYITGHFGKWHIDADPNVLGYDVHDGRNGNKIGEFDNNNKQWKNKFSEDPKKIFSLTKKAIDFIEKQNELNKPFFLQISHYAIHTNIISKEKTYRKYLNKEKSLAVDNPGLAAMNENLDEGIGIILDKIEELDLTNNTYIIYTSDNGSVPTVPARRNYDKSINFPLSRGKWDAMEGGIRVPFIVSGPKVKAIECKVPVVGYDLLPTIIDIANSDFIPKENIDGGSFKNILFGNGKGTVKRSNDGLIFHVPYENKIALNRAHSSIILDNYKLIKFRDNNELNLFDLDSDISEKIDISDLNPEITNLLESNLENYLQDVNSLKWKKGINWKNIDIKKVNSFY